MIGKEKQPPITITAELPVNDLPDNVQGGDFEPGSMVTFEKNSVTPLPLPEKLVVSSDAHISSLSIVFIHGDHVYKVFFSLASSDQPGAQSAVDAVDRAIHAKMIANQIAKASEISRNSVAEFIGFFPAQLIKKNGEKKKILVEITKRARGMNLEELQLPTVQHWIFLLKNLAEVLTGLEDVKVIDPDAGECHVEHHLLYDAVQNQKDPRKTPILKIFDLAESFVKDEKLAKIVPSPAMQWFGKIVGPGSRLNPMLVLTPDDNELSLNAGHWANYHAYLAALMRRMMGAGQNQQFDVKRINVEGITTNAEIQNVGRKLQEAREKLGDLQEYPLISKDTFVQSCQHTVAFSSVPTQTLGDVYDGFKQFFDEYFAQVKKNQTKKDVAPPRPIKEYIEAIVTPLTGQPS